MLGFPEFEAEDDIGVAELLPAPSVSLSLALSAMAVRQCGAGKTTTAAAVFEELRQQNGTPCDLAHDYRHSATSRMSPVPHNAPSTHETESFFHSISKIYWRVNPLRCSISFSRGSAEINMGATTLST